MEPETMYSLGRATEITRDEVKFAKFISRLRIKFANLFLKVLESQLILKNIIATDEWVDFKNAIRFKFAEDNYYAELKEQEILQARFGMLRDVMDYINPFYSVEWVQRHILRMTDEDMKQITAQQAKEKNDPRYSMIYSPPEEMGGDIPGDAPAPDANANGGGGTVEPSPDLLSNREK
tara:strand:+ start:44 stop:577 length:534 start_codon:yes stop_codon:yes gene_type:complete